MKRRLEALERADQFITDHPITPVIPRVTVLTTQIKAVIDQMKDHRNDQDLGSTKASDGTDERQLRAERLLAQMRKVSKIGKELDAIQFPGVRQSLRMPKRSSYQSIESRAETFLTTIAPIKTAFVDRGLAGDFDEQLQTALTDFQSATGRQSTGHTQQVGGTAGLDPSSRAGLKYLREMNGILFAAYETNPALYAAWRSASRVERAPQRKKSESAAVSAGTGSSAGTGGGGSTPTAAGTTP